MWTITLKNIDWWMIEGLTILSPVNILGNGIKFTLENAWFIS